MGISLEQRYKASVNLIENSCNKGYLDITKVVAAFNSLGLGRDRFSSYDSYHCESLEILGLKKEELVKNLILILNKGMKDYYPNFYKKKIEVGDYRLTYASEIGLEVLEPSPVHVGKVFDTREDEIVSNDEIELHWIWKLNNKIENFFKKSLGL